ncbi:MAG: hypothetical protein RMK21_06015, partial [Aquificaceae bacterium]|nr:hypothetical protein [Aquificaceae bacterium]
LRENLHALERGGGMLKTKPDKASREVALMGFNPTVWGCDPIYQNFRVFENSPKTRFTICTSQKAMF